MFQGAIRDRGRHFFFLLYPRRRTSHWQSIPVAAPSLACILPAVNRSSFQQPPGQGCGFCRGPPGIAFAFLAWLVAGSMSHLSDVYALVVIRCEEFTGILVVVVFAFALRRRTIVDDSRRLYNIVEDSRRW